MVCADFKHGALSKTNVTCYFMENFKTICQVQKLSSMTKQGKSQSQ